MPVEEADRITGVNKAVVMLGLCLAAGLVPLDITITNVAIPDIAGDFGEEITRGKSVATAYFVGEALGLGLTSWCAKRVGDIRFYLIALLLFGFFSFTCGNSITLNMLILSRFLQGLASGPLLPLTQSILLRCLPKEQALIGIAIVSGFFVIAMMAGPLLGGWITTNWGWPWIFNINPPIVVFSFFLLFYQLRNKNLPTKIEPFAWPCLLVIAALVISWQTFLDQGQELDWWNSTIVIILFILAVTFFSSLIFLELKSKKPLLNIIYFKNKNFLMANILMCFTIVIELSAFILVPLWLQTYNNYTAFWAGLTMAPFGLGAIIFVAASKPLVKYLGLFKTHALGSLITAFACFYQSYILTTDIDLYHLFIPRAIMGGGIILNYLCPTLLCKQGFEPKDQPTAISLFQLTRSILGASGIAIFVTLWQRRTIFHHNILIEKVTSFSPQTQGYLNLLKKLGFSKEQTLENLNQTIDFQAATLSLNDCFFAMGWLALIMFALCWLGKQKGTTEEIEFG